MIQRAGFQMAEKSKTESSALEVQGLYAHLEKLQIEKSVADQVVAEWKARTIEGRKPFWRISYNLSFVVICHGRRCVIIIYITLFHLIPTQYPSFMRT